MKTLRFIFGDQLSHSISSLDSLDKDNDIVLMCEVKEEATFVKHHKQKIILVFSAMRHFVAELAAKKINVHYIELLDKENTGTLDGELLRAIKKFKPDRIIITEPSEYRVLEKVHQWQKTIKTEIIIRQDNRFLCTKEEFKCWVNNKKIYRLEYFYRHMRAKHNVLMQKTGKPVGGKWNFDSENRHPLKDGISIPKHKQIAPDKITKEVIDLVKTYFNDHFGDANSFHWAVNRKDALSLLAQFIETFLPHFGEYQDAMQDNNAFIFHSILSPYLNIGLLLPNEIIKLAEKAYHDGKVPLNSVEGFMRQILGWREFIRGVYWLNMPTYAKENFLNANIKLPWFYWDAKTDMNCMHQVIKQTDTFAYSHHIQRLMVTGNFALLTGIIPKEVCEWYLIVYADAFDWVELPNTLGMTLYADGGTVGSKPYAASGK